MRTSRAGISLIELIVVIAIMATLVGMILPAIQKSRMAFRRIESANNLKQMALATLLLHDDIHMLPPACGWNNKDNKAVEGGANGTPFFMILPYLEHQNLYQQYYGPLNALKSDGTIQEMSPPAYRANYLGGHVIWGNMPPNVSSSSGTNPKTFTTILDRSQSPTALDRTTSYLGNYELLNARLSISEIGDGSSQTILYTEGFRSCFGGAILGSDSKLGDSYYYSYDSPLSNGGNSGISIVPELNPLYSLPPYTFLQYICTPPGVTPRVYCFCPSIGGSYFPTRTNSWNVGSEMIDYSPNWKLALKTTSSPVIVRSPSFQSDFSIKPFQMRRETRELQTYAISRQIGKLASLSIDGIGFDYGAVLNEQSYVMGNIPVFYSVPGYKFQALDQTSTSAWYLSFHDSGGGSGSFDIIFNNIQAVGIAYSSDAATLVRNIQAAVDAVAPNQVRVSGNSVTSILFDVGHMSAVSPIPGNDLQIIPNLSGVQPTLSYKSGSSEWGIVNSCDWFTPQAFSGSLRVAMVDGSVHSIASSISESTWRAATTPNGNDVVSEEFFE